MLTHKDELFIYIMENFPAFNGCWTSYNNCSLEIDGSYTACGLCFELSYFYIDKFNELEQKKCNDLFKEIEKVLFFDENNDLSGDLADSLKGCFLENISHTIAGEKSKEWMGTLSRTFFEQCHDNYKL